MLNLTQRNREYIIITDKSHTLILSYEQAKTKKYSKYVEIFILLIPCKANRGQSP